ncbi:MAG: hypothetical protein Q8908_04510 [Bacteroidota bacterium]|nr:hypothetical protein [Bacteroidota bacterium]
MIIRKADMINFLVRALFMALFCLMLSGFRNLSFQEDNSLVKNDWMTLVANGSMNAVPSDAIRLPLFEKSWVSFVDHSNVTFFNARLMVFANDEKTTQRIRSLQKIIPPIKTTLVCGFYYHLFPIDNEVPPALS